jgi:hypothetical protein
MELLSQVASDHSDPSPQLQMLHEKCFISCNIRPVCSLGSVVPCKIFYECIAIDSIKICSAEFDHQQHLFLEKNFTQFEKYFNLENEDQAERFFRFALSMEDPFSSCSDYDGNGDSDEDMSQAPAPAQGLLGWPKWLFLKLQDECGNEQVVKSIRESMMRRFGKVGSLEHLKLVTKSEPLNALRPEYFGCEVVLVSNDAARKDCLAFIDRESHLSFDTESTIPKKDSEGICLIQIGTTTNVFIIQVGIQSKDFLFELGACLSDTKTLICWGDDQKALKKVVPNISCTFQDLQTKFSTKGQKRGIQNCVEDLFDKKYVLSKTWTLSGWDNPQLYKDQIRYAALDVVACHALFLSTMDISVYESHGVHITFYASDLKSSKFKHGFSFASDFLGHYKNNVVSRGFAWGSSQPLPPRLIGFCVFEDISLGAHKVGVKGFLTLLNDFKFCCSLCSKCWVLQKQWRFFDKSNRDSFGYLKGDKHAVLSCPVRRVSNDTDEQDAFFCLSIVAFFLHMSPSEDNLQSLKKSVCSDVYYGYIRETLAHLT